MPFLPCAWYAPIVSTKVWEGHAVQLQDLKSWMEHLDALDMGLAKEVVMIREGCDLLL
jgi:hypothetical protein